MFSLIITIVSIGLVIALALATIYFGGPAWTAGNERAAAGQAMNAGHQVVGAVHMYRVQQGQLPEVPQDLVEHEYLKAIPVGVKDLTESVFQFGNDYVYTSVPELNMCQAINTRLNIPAPVPMCEDPEVSGREVCCEATPE